MTAGHCISSKTGTASKIQVIPGRDGGDWPFGHVMADEFFLPSEWQRGREKAFDYGAIKLPNGDMGGRTGHFPIAEVPADRIRKLGLNTAGYPGDMKPSRALHYNAGKVEAVYPQRLSYFLDTWTGASGSPVWVKDGESRHAVGIHNYGHCPNRCTRINARVLQDLQGWISG